MRTPRTVDEIADAILPASIDGLHERALCLLLAEHEAAIAELRRQIDVDREQSEWVRGYMEAHRCEPGEEGRMAVALNASTNAAASDQRAPGSAATAPTTEEVDQALERLHRIHAYTAARVLRALAADRDRLARIVAKDQEWAALASCNSVEDMHAELGHQIGQRREAVSDRNLIADNLEEMQRERDALQRRIEAMTAREPTPEEGLALARVCIGWGNPVDGAWEFVRDALLATPASEPSEGPCPQCGRGICVGCAPQPSPATPSAEDVVRWEDFIQLNAYMVNWGGRSATDFARALAAEVARREAALRTERDTFERHADEYRKQRDGARAALAAANTALEHLRSALDTANESNAKLFKRLDAAEDHERKWRDGFTNAVLTLRSHSDVYEAWKRLDDEQRRAATDEGK